MDRLIMVWLPVNPKKRDLSLQDYNEYLRRRP